MSTIDKLTIQGIRSFGPNADDAQSITFSSPVTLILGENGCGKTTIIECLKYALTSECPPGSDRGKNFVHDPKISSLSDTLGQIKLQVRNLRGECLSVCRSMKISNRRGKVTFETLDSTMNYMNAAGDTIRNPIDSISKRCINVDTAMCDFMGVSKAIINNVLFCHQEDASWPLDEPKKLKEKFDAIFGITEYNKAIERLVKMRKEEMDEFKVKEANLRFLTHLKQEMEDKTLCLQKAKEKCDNVKELCERVDNEMKPLDDRLKEIRDIEYEVGKHQSRRVELDTNFKNYQDQKTSLRKKIKQLFTGSIDELNVEIRCFNDKVAEKRVKQNALNKELDKLEIEKKEIKKQHTDKDRELCVVQEQLQQELDCNVKRAKHINELCEKLDITHYDNLEESRNRVPDVLEQIKDALDRTQRQINDNVAQHEIDDQQRQQEIDKLRVNITKLEEGIVTLKKQKICNEQEAEELSGKIAEIEKTGDNLKKLTQEIERVDQLYNSLSEKFNQDGLRTEINEKKQTIEELEKKYQKVDERLTFLNSISKLTAEIALKEKELEKKEQEVRRVKSKHADNLKKVFDNASLESNYRRRLQDTYESIRREIKTLNEKTSALKLKEQSHDIKRKNLKDEIVRLEKELEESRERIYETCHAAPYQDLLDKCNATVLKYQLEFGALRSAEAMYKKYMQKIEEDPFCPLCHTSMSADKAADITTELSDEIHQLPENIKRTEKLLKAEQKRYDKLLQLQPVIERVSRLEEDVPKRKEELKRIQEQLVECANDSESLQLALAEPTYKLDLANSMFGDMSLLDEALKEIARLKVDIDKLKTKLPAGYENSASIDDLQLEKAATFAELENERKLLERKRHDYEKTVDGLSKLREKKNELKDKQIRMQEGLQSLPQLKERQSDLVTLIEVSEIELQEQQARVQPLKQQLNAAIAQKTQHKETHRKQLTQMQLKFEKHKSLDHDIQRLHKEMLNYEKLNLSDQLENIKTALKTSKKKIEDLNENIGKVTEEYNAASIPNQDSVERDFKDNLELKLLEEKIKALGEERDKLAKQLGDLNFKNVSREKAELIKKREDGTVRKGELLGQIGEINNQMKKLQDEINDPKYKDSVQNYRRAHYEVEVSKRMIVSLGQYRVASEWALIQFHTEKMAQINRLIREYWRLIYRGNDIDYIQVQTDEAKTDASAADRRRSYNYRVIQCKNNSEIEMRGRCSAGQRVLASLIIRMALAETFSSNCGVLALDEPTTNLDHNNIVSLCDALNRVVEQRELQTNFMLIIITHDEQFISTLGKISRYHRVFRNDECKSVIRKVKVT